MATDGPYALVSTDDLIEELLGRFDHAAFIGMQCGVQHDTRNHAFYRRYVGNTMTVMGLCMDMVLMSHDSFEQTRIAGDDELSYDENDDSNLTT